MKCPRCGKELCEQTVGSVAVDACNGGCGGVWFDNFELKRLLSADEAEQDQLKANQNPNVKKNGTDRLKCPKCLEVVMQNHPYPGHWEINIDECARCGGVWLDGGEFEQIRNVARNDPPPNISGGRRREAPATTGAYFSRKLYGRGAFSSTLGNMSGEPVADGVDALTSLPSKSTPWKTWWLGIVLPGLFVWGFIRTLISLETSAFTPTGAAFLTGWTAVSFRLIWLSVGFLLHFHFFWGVTERLKRYAVPAKVMSLGLLIISCFIFLWQCITYMNAGL